MRPGPFLFHDKWSRHDHSDVDSERWISIFKITAHVILMHLKSWVRCGVKIFIVGSKEPKVCQENTPRHYTATARSLNASKGGFMLSCQILTLPSERFSRNQDAGFYSLHVSCSVKPGVVFCWFELQPVTVWLDTWFNEQFEHVNLMKCLSVNTSLSWSEQDIKWFLKLCLHPHGHIDLIHLLSYVN